MNAAVWIAAIIVLAYVGFLILIVMSAVAVRVTRAVRGWLRRRRAERRMGAAALGISSDVLAVMCDPCNGRPGKCICTSKQLCSHPLCGAEDTGVSDAQFSRELRALLDRELPQ